LTEGGLGAVLAELAGRVGIPVELEISVDTLPLAVEAATTADVMRPEDARRFPRGDACERITPARVRILAQDTDPIAADRSTFR
jgi:hypothetical protein